MEYQGRGLSSSGEWILAPNVLVSSPYSFLHRPLVTDLEASSQNGDQKARKAWNFSSKIVVVLHP